MVNLLITLILKVNNPLESGTIRVTRAYEGKMRCSMNFSERLGFYLTDSALLSEFLKAPAMPGLFIWAVVEDSY
jgi:hypothetical protein